MSSRFSPAAYFDAARMIENGGQCYPHTVADAVRLGSDDES